MTVDTVLENAKLYLRGRIVEAGLAIDGGRITKIAKTPNLPEGSEKIDVEGRLILPGLIDVHVHLRDQGLSYKEDFYTGTAAAANGGITLVMDMPNNEPTTMSLNSLRERMRIAEGRILVNTAFYSAFPKNVGEIGKIITEGGAVAFKLYMVRRIGGVDPTDREALNEAFRETARFGVSVAIHAEDIKMIEAGVEAMRNLGRNDPEAYLEVHTPEAEVKAIREVARLTEKTKAKVHICHLSSSAGVEAVSEMKSRGLPVTCEVTPHHLLLTSEYAKRLGGLALMDPPLRSEGDVKGLWRALHRGVIDIVASDHAPHTLEEKSGSSIWDVKTGIPGLETTLPLLLTEVYRGRLTLQSLVRLTSERPAEVFGITGRGRISEGGYADLVVVDMKRRFKIDSSSFLSKAKFSPFDGWEVRGKPVKTFVNGRLVMDDGEIVAKPGVGVIIRRMGGLG